jgi:hypothetical protein
MVKGKKRFLILLVVILVVIGVGSTIYILLSKGAEKTEGLLVGETEFSLNELFDNSELITVEEYQGVSLAEIIDKAGIENPEAQEYTIIAEDGYQKTVEWESIQEGIFTSEKRVVFPDLPHQYWIKNTTKIEIREK